MSRSWRELEYLYSTDLWSFIDQESEHLDSKMKDPIAKKTTAYKMYILGQKEALDRVATYLHEHEKTLDEIATIHDLISRWDAIEKENLDADRAWDQQNILDKE